MAIYYLVILEAAHIEPYIYGSNRLRENISASYLVAEATSAFPCDVLRNMPGQFAVGGQFFDKSKWIERDNLDAEVLYAGGGNFSALFKNPDQARVFIRELSRKVLCIAPGLQIEALCKEIKWEEDLKAQYKEALDDLSKNQQAQTLSTPLSGLGVTRVCQSTGQVAVGKTEPIAGDKESILFASAEVLAKRAAINDSNKRLRDLFKEKSYEKYTFPYDFDQLGRTGGDFSYIAVVYIDGDGMGDRIAKIEGRDNRDYINKFRNFSEGLNNAGENSLKETISNTLISSIDEKEYIKEIELVSNDNNHWFLPIRPVVYGGDDLFFVCDARIGISLAINYIKAFEKYSASLPDGKGKATACAGISIISTHYPFSSACELARELCESAKNYRRQLDVRESFIDWHFAEGGLYGDLQTIRSREYLGRQLTLRPVSIDVNEKEPLRSWNVIETGCRNFQGDAWKSRRSKVKALRDALRDGPDSVKSFRKKYLEGEKLFRITELPDFSIEETGWKEDRCCYYDPVELFDWYISLLPEVKNEAVS